MFVFIYSLFGILFLRILLLVVMGYERNLLCGFYVPPMYGVKLKKMSVIFDFRLLGMNLSLKWF